MIRAEASLTVIMGRARFVVRLPSPNAYAILHAKTCLNQDMSLSQPGEQDSTESIFAIRRRLGCWLPNGERMFELVSKIHLNIPSPFFRDQTKCPQ